MLLMRMVSFNTRGLGGRVKRSAVRELVASEKVDFLCLQETKLDYVDKKNWCANCGGILTAPGLTVVRLGRLVDYVVFGIPRCSKSRKFGGRKVF